MPSEAVDATPLAEAAVAFVFPGQGPQRPEMLAAWPSHASFSRLYPLLCETLGEDVRREVERRGSEYLSRNEIASPVTLFCSALERLRLCELGLVPEFAAGYSVGQWSAMVTAGMLSLEDALRVVRRRAELMNETDAVRDGAMLAVIGLATERVEEVCRETTARGTAVAISNFNCVGQLTLAGTRAGIAQAEESLRLLSPRKLARVEVSGAWHSSLLEGAVAPFRAFLDGVSLAAPTLPVMDNVTGVALPEAPGALRDHLARHLTAPVRWDACVKELCRLGAGHFVETGYGDMLSKFGFFIDRSRKHTPSSKLG